MTDEEKAIEFKSTPENFEKEESGIKNNTLRGNDDSDIRFQTLKRWSESGKYGIIRIKRTTDGKTFERKIRDATCWLNLWIITWDDNQFEKGIQRGREEVLGKVEKKGKWNTTKYEDGMVAMTFLSIEKSVFEAMKSKRGEE